MALTYLAHARPTAPGFENSLGSGLLAGVGAIVTYHLVTGNFLQSSPKS
jgi:hypothetical protein